MRAALCAANGNGFRSFNRDATHGLVRGGCVVHDGVMRPSCSLVFSCVLLCSLCSMFSVSLLSRTCALLPPPPSALPPSPLVAPACSLASHGPGSQLTHRTYTRQVSAKSRLLPKFKLFPIAPDGSRWLLLVLLSTNTRCCWLLLAPNSS